MSYDATALDVGDPTDLSWAIAWARFWLRDTGTTPVYAEPEIVAAIKAYAWTVTVDGVSTVYYRPHVSAATLVESDPDRATSEAILGVSLTTRGPSAIAAAIRKAGRFVDDLIETATGGERPPSGRSLVPVF